MNKNLNRQGYTNLKNQNSTRGGSWELAGSCVGCPIDGLRGSVAAPSPPQTADGYSPMTAYNTTAEN